MKFEKFPKFVFQGKELLWDIRQKIAKPYVVIRKDLDLKLIDQLKEISSQALVEGKDFSSWGEWLAELANFPSSRLKIIGVVGTSGKTTTTALLRYLLVEEGKKVMEIGTFGVSLWGGRNNNKAIYSEYTGFTSPDAQILQDLLRQAVSERVDVVVMEVTSHAIALGRVEGVEFDAAIFLNLSQDHLDFHGTLLEYKRVKKSFFLNHLTWQKTKKPYMLINTNDSTGKELQKDLANKGQVSFEALLRDKGYSVDEKSLNVKINNEVYPFVGHFLAENILSAAYVVAKLLNLKAEDLILKFKKFPGISGRMEILDLNYQSGMRHFIVDYAHKPEALEKNLQILKAAMKAGKLWVLFGCGGDRDALKRPLMGQIAAKYADEVVVTSDNPRSEDPLKIIEEIVSPLKAQGIRYRAEVSREEAMKYCIAHMGDSDLCFVAGRGDEEFQLIGDQKIPFRDSAVLRRLCAL